jgi:hypothetical protein
MVCNYTLFLARPDMEPDEYFDTAARFVDSFATTKLGALLSVNVCNVSGIKEAGLIFISFINEIVTFNSLTYKTVLLILLYNKSNVPSMVSSLEETIYDSCKGQQGETQRQQSAGQN